MRVPVDDFRIEEEERRIINDVLDSGRITEGERVREFEKKWANFIGTRYAIAVSSGTSALIAGLVALRYHKNLGINKSYSGYIDGRLTKISLYN